MNRTKILFIVISFLFLSNMCYAGRVVSADLSFQYVGGQTYQFTLTAYRDCSDIFSFLPSYYYINVYSKSCQVVAEQFKVTQYSKTIVSASCPSNPSYCQGGTAPGYEKYVYKGTYTVPQQCTDWIFYWIECNRSSTIANIQNAGTTCINVEATLNNKDFSNVNSPTFTTDLTGVVAAGQSNSINLGVQSNGDSIAYSSITPLSGFNIANGSSSPVQYANGYTPSNPFNSNGTYNVDNATGTITFTPSTSSNSETDVITILVQQYRNHKLVSSIMKDQQVVIFNIPLPSINTSAIPTLVCANSPVTVTFTGTDVSGNKTALSWNSGISNASFTIKDTSKYSLNQKAIFSWTPSNNDVGQHSFIVTVKNDACPLVGQQNFLYNIQVIPSPQIVLRQDTTVLCGKSYPLKASVYNAVNPFTYKWNTGETTDSIYKPYGIYTLTVTAANLCTDVDSVRLIPGLNVDFKITNTTTCAGNTLQFLNLTTTPGNITSINWTFGDGTTSSNTSPSHYYPNAVLNNFVSLTVSDNNGCTKTETKKVSICSIPTYTVTKKDTCDSNTAISYTAGSSVCPIASQYIDWGDGNTILSSSSIAGFWVENTISGITNHGYKNITSFPATFQISSYATNSGNCSATQNVTMEIYPTPTWITSPNQSASLNCNNRTLTLTGIATTTATSIPSLLPLKYTWSSSTNATINVIDNNNATVSDTGYYNLTVTDKRGCTTKANYLVSYPIRAKILVKKGNCSGIDSVEFVDNTSSAWQIKSRFWNFGDGTTATGIALSHLFPQPTIYKVTLTDTDTTNCSSSASVLIYNAKPLNQIPKPYLCYDTLYTLLAPSNDDIGDVLVDSVSWGISNNNSIWYPATGIPKTQTRSNLSLFSPTVEFNYSGLNIITATAFYNYGCSLNYVNSIYVYKKIQNEAYVINPKICADSNLIFAAKKLVSENQIVQRTWTIALGNNTWTYKTPMPYSSDTTSRFDTILPPALQNNSSFYDLTNKSKTNLIAKVITKDIKGCQTDTFTYFRNDVMTLNKFQLTGKCINDDSLGLQYLNLNFQDPAGVMYSTLSEWTYQGITKTGYVSGITITLTSAGVVPVSLKVINRDTTCSLTYSDNIFVLPAPKAAFDATAVCFGGTTKFNNLSLPAAPGDSIISYRWKLTPTDTNIRTKNTQYKYPKAGTYNATLYVVNSAVNNINCKDSVQQQIVVLPKPTADFAIATSPDEQQTNVPIQFTDLTSPSDTITTWAWKFSKKDSAYYSKANNPTVTYDSIGIYNVRQIVTNNVGCSDTIYKRLDLNSYLILPTAFSPNGDNENDHLYLLYKGIKKLIEFRIYNRFGEKVFDAGNNINSQWDGNQLGLPSPVGAYVYYVSAESNYGNTISYKGQVTLLR